MPINIDENSTGRNTIDPEWKTLHELFHDTKNPLQVIISSLDMLERERNPEMEQYLHAMIRESALKINAALNQFIQEAATGNPEIREYVKTDI